MPSIMNKEKVHGGKVPRKPNGEPVIVVMEKAIQVEADEKKTEEHRFNWQVMTNLVKDSMKLAHTAKERQKELLWHLNLRILLDLIMLMLFVCMGMLVFVNILEDRRGSPRVAKFVCVVCEMTAQTNQTNERDRAIYDVDQAMEQDQLAAY